jgi:hypothetical protein
MSIDKQALSCKALTSGQRCLGGHAAADVLDGGMNGHVNSCGWYVDGGNPRWVPPSLSTGKTGVFVLSRNTHLQNDLELGNKKGPPKGEPYMDVMGGSDLGPAIGASQARPGNSDGASHDPLSASLSTG